MDFIIEEAKTLTTRYFNYGIHYEPEEFVDSIRQEASKYKSKLDKIKFLTEIVQRINEKNSLKNSVNYKIIHFLNYDLEELGIVVNDDTFTVEEKQSAESKIDELLNKIDDLLKDNQTLKHGHEILYNEIQELKELFFLGKKNWKQLLAGKVGEMVTGGIVSETVAHSIVDALSPVTKMLLG